MTLIHEERPSDSPYVESITRGWTTADGSSIRPAETHWHMVFVRVNGRSLALHVGPLTSAGVAAWGAGAEILWVKFRLGVFMPHLPAKDFLNVETFLPEAGGQSFWLNGSAWQLPDFENADTFADQLARRDVLAADPVVNAALQDRASKTPLRTIRHRFAQATGLSQSHIRQHDRAQQAAALLRQGVSILDAAYHAGYYDQPHLTRSLKRFVGQTPAQLALPTLPE